MERKYEHVVNFSLSNGNVRQLDRLLSEWLEFTRAEHAKCENNDGCETLDLAMSDWVSEFRIYVNQAESFQS